MLLEALVKTQRTLGLNDEEFAARLGVSRQMWQMTRTGVVQIGEAVLSNVTAEFPELHPEVYFFLRENAKVTRESPDSVAPPVRRRGRKPRDFTYVTPKPESEAVAS